MLRPSNALGRMSQRLLRHHETRSGIGYRRVIQASPDDQQRIHVCCSSVRQSKTLDIKQQANPFRVWLVSGPMQILLMGAAGACLVAPPDNHGPRVAPLLGRRIVDAGDLGIVAPRHNDAAVCEPRDACVTTIQTLKSFSSQRKAATKTISATVLFPAIPSRCQLQPQVRSATQPCHVSDIN